MLCTIWYRLYNLRNVKTTHEGVLLLAKLQFAILLKVTLLHGRISRFLNCRNGTKSRKASHMSTKSNLQLNVLFPETLKKFCYDFLKKPT